MASIMKKSKVQNSRSKVRSPKSEVSRIVKFESSEYKPKNEYRKLETERAKNVIFGVLPVLEALRAETRRVEKIFIAEGANEKRFSDILLLARQNGVPFQKIAKENLSKYVERDANHQGIIATVASADYYPADELLDEIYR
jgi:tRNA G18 (ribose-2'-O)-methylase SpoU